MNKRAIAAYRQIGDCMVVGAWGDEIAGFAMKDTIRAFVLGMLILLAALIPPAILLMHYFGH